MSDQTMDTNPEVISPPIGIEDYFGIEGTDQITEDSSKEVKSDQTDKTGEDITKENGSESKDSKNKSNESTEDKKTTKTEGSKEEDTKSDSEDDEDDDAQSEEYEVAGTKYKSLEEAVKAVNRINGDNTRLSGDVKSLRKEKIELETQVQELEGLLKDFKGANEEWQKYYEGEGEKPDHTRIDIEELINQKVKEIKKSEENIAIKQQFDSELDEIFALEDFDKVEPFFKTLIDEYEGVKKPPHPKTLYKRAQRDYMESLGDNDLKDLDSLEKLAEEKANKILAKKEASKTKSNTGGSGKTDTKEELPPEVADYFAQVI